MQKTLIIAEAGVNHNGDIALAKKLIEVASKSGADFVKFQSFKTEEGISINAPKAKYQIANATNKSESQFDMIKKLELDRVAHLELINHCQKCGIKFLSTPFDLPSIALLSELEIEIFKIPSGEITNLPYLRKINFYGKKVILSTGMATLDEIQDALNVLKNCKVSLLHCTTEYPCPYSDVNLNAMQTMKERFGLEVGYSDHTQGIEIPVAAVAMGATIIEKHFTLDRNMDGPDHKASLEPNELKQMVDSIRNIEKAFGDGIKAPQESEKKNIAIARKSIVAKCKIKKGDIFTEKNITTKRPGIGISPMQWDEVIGKVANRDYVEDEIISLKIEI